MLNEKLERLIIIETDLGMDAEGTRKFYNELIKNYPADEVIEMIDENIYKLKAFEGVKDIVNENKELTFIELSNKLAALNFYDICLEDVESILRSGSVAITLKDTTDEHILNVAFDVEEIDSDRIENSTLLVYDVYEL